MIARREVIKLTCQSIYIAWRMIGDGICPTPLLAGNSPYFGRKTTNLEPC
jgi:uncharacterized circularly permuted ATP-grasp superfamily protein